MTAGGDLAPGEKTPGLLGGANVLFNNPWTFLAPGSTADRPVPSAAIDGRLRFNTDTLIYEYYDTLVSMWVPLSGSGTGTVNPGTANSIAFYAANGTAVSPTNTANLSVLVTNGSGFPSLSTTLPTGLSIPDATITASTADLTSGQIAATPVNPTDIVNKAYVDSSVGSGVTSITGTTNQVIASSPTGAVTLSLPQDIATGSTPTFAGITLTSIPLGGSSGGTGINNGASTLTLGGSLATIGAFTAQFTFTGATSVIFPTTGTLATTSGTVSSVSGTANQIDSTGGTTPILSIANNPILPGLGGVTLPGGTTAQRAGGAGTIRFNSQTTLFESTVDGTVWATIETSATGVTSITGTANQVIASSPTGAVTLSLPQDIAPASTVTFNSVIATSSLSTANITMTANGSPINSADGFGTLKLLISGGTSVNSTAIVGGPTGINPQLIMNGSDTNVGLQVTCQAAGIFAVKSTSSSPLSILSGTSSQHTSTMTFPNTAASQTYTWPDATGTVALTAGSGGLKSFQIFTTGTAATYTKPAGITSILVEVLGAGAGGGGATGGSGTASQGAGGGAGGYARLWIPSASASYTYTVGVGGAGGVAGNNTGSSGGATNFLAGGLQGNGGGGGSGMGAIATATASAAVGGDGGVGLNGNINVKGMPGLWSLVVVGFISGASGGSSHYGGGGVLPSLTPGAGGAAGNYGSGGSGGYSTTVSSAGGAGSSGLIIVWEFA